MKTLQVIRSFPFRSRRTFSVPWRQSLSLGAAWFLAFVAVVGRPLAADAAETNRPTLYVAPLQGEKGMGFWQPAIGEGLAEMFITELSGLGKFEMLESTALESVKDYVKLGQDGWIEANENVEKGHWNGADYMFVGRITRFGSRSKIGRWWRDHSHLQRFRGLAQ